MVQSTHTTSASSSSKSTRSQLGKKTSKTRTSSGRTSSSRSQTTSTTHKKTRAASSKVSSSTKTSTKTSTRSTKTSKSSLQTSALHDTGYSVQAKKKISYKADGKNLVIVESPSKAKTISKYLGSDYEVKASMGHIIDLPNKSLAIDMQTFIPHYEVSADKKKVVTELIALANKSKQVWLATDEDREGEAIARHLGSVLGLDFKHTPRIVFHEITKPALTHAIAHPRTLDFNLVYSQQTRRVLDRIVGYQISPILWRKLKPGLSAGRVQSVAVKLIVSREREITNFNPWEYRTLSAELIYQKETLKIVCQTALFASQSKYTPRTFHLLPDKTRSQEPDNLPIGGPIKERNTVSAIIKHWSEDKYLIARWKQADYKRFPGGGVEAGETHLEAIQREIHEETGYTDYDIEAQALGDTIHTTGYHKPKDQIYAFHDHTFVISLKSDRQVNVAPSEIAKHDMVRVAKDEVGLYLNDDAHRMVRNRYLLKDSGIDLKQIDQNFVKAHNKAILAEVKQGRFDQQQIQSLIQALGIHTTESINPKTQLMQMTSLDSVDFVLKDIVTKASKKSSPPPFITSTLQQVASRSLGRGVKQVMSTAQKLYEHGYITYMRTDSTNLSSTALDQIKSFVVAQYGKQYAQPTQYVSKSKNAQEAHEAIRPTNMETQTADIALGSAESKLYNLIWKRTIASQMTDALYENTTYTFNPKPAPTQSRTAEGKVLKFDGWLKVYGKDEDDESQTLPLLKLHTILSSKSLTIDQNFTSPPARFTEASLVKALESKGIGRPSTYATVITTIQTRGYVVKQDNKLLPTEIAFKVTDHLSQYFKAIMDYDFTAQMEQKLDDIAVGDAQRDHVLTTFNRDFQDELAQFNDGQRVDTTIDKICPKCGQPLKLKFSKSGSFVGCSGYPDCDYIEQTADKQQKLDEMKAKYEGLDCPAGGKIVVKTGRFGPFLTSDQYPDIKRIKSPAQFEAERMMGDQVPQLCDKCGVGHMVIKTSRKGPFRACDQYPTCKNAKSLKSG